MPKFICDKCDKSKLVANYSIRIVDNKIVVPEAVCCDNYMTFVKEKHGGWGTIRKGPDGSVKRKPKPWE